MALKEGGTFPVVILDPRKASRRLRRAHRLPGLPFLALLAAGFAPVAQLPPDGFVLVRWEGGLCGDFCALLFLPAAGRFGRAIWSFKVLCKISIIRYHYKMYMRAFM